MQLLSQKLSCRCWAESGGQVACEAKSACLPQAESEPVEELPVMRRVCESPGTLMKTSLAFAAVLLVTGSALAQDARPIVVEAAEARVAVQLEPASATLLQRDRLAVATTGRGSITARGFRELCSGSCRLKMKEGTYTMALALEGNAITDSVPVSIPAGDSRLIMRHESHGGRRAGGWVLVGTSPVTWWGSGLLLKVANGGDPISGGQVALITGVALTQLALGIWLVATGGDELGVEIVPLPPTANAAAFAPREPTTAQRAFEGLGVQVAF
jgi:hypothetical protein